MRVEARKDAKKANQERLWYAKQRKWSCGDPQLTNIQRQIWERLLYLIVKVTLLALTANIIIPFK